MTGRIVASKPRGGILVFLPGVQEIRQCIQALSGDLGKHAEIMPLHANLTSDEQRAVFRTVQKWKIVVATNVAEASPRFFIYKQIGFSGVLTINVRLLSL